MTKLKWEEGKMYRIKPDWVDAFVEALTTNKKIAQLIGNNAFTVTKVSEHSGRVLKIAEWSSDLINLDYWFYADEIKYFDLVEDSDVEYRKEKQMKYKCIKDFWMEDRLRENKPAFSVGNVYEFRPISIEEMRDGFSDLVTIPNDQGRIHYMPMCDINEHFELVDEEQEMSPTKTEQEIVVEWLEKLHYVMRNDSSVSEELQLYGGGLMLSTDLCDVYGATGIYDFINKHYDAMKTQAETKRKKELLDKRAALELELAEIKKELGE